MPKVHAGDNGSAGRGRGRRVSTSLAEINVVPLVDVMLVLLIIFMVTAPMIQRGIDVNLPQARRADTVEGERLFITVPASFQNDGMVYINQERVRADAMQERVRQKMTATPDKEVYLRGDGAVQLQELMTIIDRLKAAGVVKVGIVAKAPEKSSVDVTDILRDRIGEPPGLQRMVVASLAIHAVLVGGFLAAPGTWLSPPAETPKAVMTISLGGGNGGPANGGLTAIGGRAIQAETPPDAKRPEPLRAPAAVTPEMTVPIPGKKPVKASTTTPVKQAPEQAKGRNPTRGAETRAGSALAETGARGQGFGLSTGGGVGAGSTLDVQDFCCPDYLMTMVERIRTNWNARADVPGMTVIKYTIQRDGTITNPEIERPSGYTALDINSLRAVAGTRQLPALPSAFPNQTLTVHLNFQYTR